MVKLTIEQIEQIILEKKAQRKEISKEIKKFKNVITLRKLKGFDYNI